MSTITDSTKRTMEDGGFTASDIMADHLQQLLVDLIGLQLQAKHAHWNIVGHNFRDLHLQLDGIVDDARNAADTVAERMRALGASADGRAPTVAATARLTPLPNGELQTATAVGLITASLRNVTSGLRHALAEIDEQDPPTSDLLHAVIVQLEKQTWILSAENRLT